jgi:hypothetical protein
MTPTDLTPIDTKLEGIGHVLRDRRLRVPPYQRVYSWDQEEVADFWWDLRAARGSSSSQYFLGTLVLTRDDDNWTTIIDGQQRLATTVLLFAALRNEFVRRGDTDRAGVIERDYIALTDLRTALLTPRLRLNIDDDTQFRNLVLDGSMEPGPEEAPPTNERIQAALEFFGDRVRDEAKDAGLHWPEALFAWVEFLEKRARVISVEVSDEADAFLIFETLNARGRELTVADLLKNYLFGLGREKLHEVQEHWISALGALEASANEEVFTTFIRHLWSAQQGATRERELYARLKSSLTSEQAAVAFAQELDETAPLYAALLSADHQYWVHQDALVPVAETVLRLGLEQNRPLLLAAMRRFDSSEFHRLLSAVISWSVRGLIVGGIGGGTTERAYAEAAVLVTEGTARDSAAVFDELASIIPSDEAFVESVAYRRVNRTRLAKYYLLALLKAEEGQSSPATVSDEEERAYSLHFVLPRRPDPREWSNFPADELSQWSLRLGNQFLRSDDEVVGPGEVTDLSQWSPDDVSDRQWKLAELAPMIWPRRP